MKYKKLISLLTSIAMMFAMIVSTGLSFITAEAADSLHSGWVKVSGSFPVAPGNYILTGNITCYDTVSLAQGATVSICLNGYSINFYGQNSRLYLYNNATLNIYDETGSGVLSAQCGNTSADTGTVFLTQGAKVNIYGGTVKNTGTYSIGTAIYGANTDATVNVYGGNVSATNYGINVKNGAKANISGGTVSATVQYAVSCSGSSSAVSVTGGTISGKQYGLYNSSGKITVAGGTIISDTYHGVYHGGSSFDLSGGAVIDGMYSDIFLSSGCYININGQLKNTEPYYVKSGTSNTNPPASRTKITNSSNTSYNDPSKFTSYGRDGYKYYPVEKSSADNQLYIECRTYDTHTHDGLVFDPYDVTTIFPLSGNYRLEKDITVTRGDANVASPNLPLSICLNGHKATLANGSYVVPALKTINFYDCTGKGSLNGNEQAINVQGTVNIYGGNISGTKYGVICSGTLGLYNAPSIKGSAGNADIFLTGDGKIRVGDSLTGKYSINMETPGVFSASVVDDDKLACFTSARSGYVVIINADGYLELHKHNYSGKETKSASCTAEGIMTYTCKCGDFYTEAISATGHNYVGKITQEPTCIKEGIRIYRCSECDAFLKTEAVEKIPHTPSNTWTTDKEATCSETGLKSHHCLVCGEKLDITSIPKTSAHSYKSTVTKAATTTSTGIMTYTCSVCGDSYTKIIPMLESLSPVTGFTVKSSTSNSITLGWTKNSNADGYIIEKKVGNDWERVAKISDNSTVKYTVTDLAKQGKTYTFRIRAYISNNSSTVYSSYVNVSGATALTKAADFTVKSTTSSSITLGWTKNSNADGYIIEKKVGNDWERVAKISDNSTVKYTVTDLAKQGKTYTFRIRAYTSNDGDAVYSSDVTASGATALTKAADFTVKSTTSNSITLGWTKNSNADGYIIEKKVGDSWERVAKISDNATVKYTVTGLVQQGKTYTFRIRAYTSNGGDTVYSSAVTASGATALTKAADFTVKSTTSSSITLGWTKNSNADGYIIEKKVGDSWERVDKVSDGAATSYKVSGLSSSKTYTFRIRAYTSNGGDTVYSSYVTVSGTTNKG